MKKYRYILLLAAYVLLWVLCRSTVEYTVTFDPNGGELVEGELVQSVKIRKGAQAPILDNGRLELHWDRPFDDIREETMITAQWVKVPLAKDALTDYVRERTVYVHSIFPDGTESVAAGFFLDESGRVATAFGTVAGAEEIRVERLDGSIRAVEMIADYNRLYDLAVLDTGWKDTPWLEPAAGLKAGDALYGWTNSLQTIRTGELVGMDASYGRMTCLNTSLPSVLPGAPVVDKYGDLAAMHHSRGDKKELAVDAALLPELAMDKQKTVEEFLAWYNTEKSRSYEVLDGGSYRPAMVRTYQMVIGAECTHSLLGYARYEGYYLRFDGYIYEYFEPEFNLYRDYLAECGYDFQGEETEGNLRTYHYRSEQERVEIILTVNEEKSELEIRLKPAES